jgi:drug/metabolite transporter (DMT)-like permease
MSAMPATIRPMTAPEWTLLVVLSILWGGSFFFVGVAVQELPPLTIVTLRVALAALALHVIIRLLGARMPTDRRAWGAFFGLGLLNNVVPFALMSWAQIHIASAVASILNATTPLFTILIAHISTRDEPMTARRLSGVMVGFVGVVIMIGGSAIHTFDTQCFAQLACLIATASYACAGVFGRRFEAVGVAPLATATGQVSASSLMLLPLALMVDQPWQLTVPSTLAITSLIALALISTAVAYVIYFRILATAGATNLLLVTFLIPASAILLGVFILGERLEYPQIVGMLTIALGLAAVDGRVFAVAKQALAVRGLGHGR